MNCHELDYEIFGDDRQIVEIELDPAEVVIAEAGTGKKRVAFAAPHSGKIIALDMASLGEELICQKDAFLCAALGTSIDITFQKRLGAGFFGGEGFILQRLRGDGKAFVHIGDRVSRKELRGVSIKRASIRLRLALLSPSSRSDQANCFSLTSSAS